VESGWANGDNQQMAEMFGMSFTPDLQRRFTNAYLTEVLGD